MVDSSAAAPAGIAVHLLLSLLLAGVFTVAVWLPFARKLRFVPAMLVAVAALSGVWAINFFVILPVLNPAFVVLLPYAATLFSKVLFGIAMASGLAYAGGSRSVAPAKQRSEASHSSANVALARAYVRRSEEQGSRRRRDVTAKANRSSRVCCGSVFRYGVASSRDARGACSALRGCPALTDPLRGPSAYAPALPRNVAPMWQRGEIRSMTGA